MSGRRGQSPWIFLHPRFPPCSARSRLRAMPSSAAARALFCCLCVPARERPSTHAPPPTLTSSRPLANRSPLPPPRSRGDSLAGSHANFVYQARVQFARIFHFLLSVPLTETRLISCVSHLPALCRSKPVVKRSSVGRFLRWTSPTCVHRFVVTAPGCALLGGELRGHVFCRLSTDHHQRAG